MRICGLGKINLAYSQSIHKAKVQRKTHIRHWHQLSPRPLESWASSLIFTYPRCMNHFPQLVNSCSNTSTATSTFSKPSLSSSTSWSSGCVCEISTGFIIGNDISSDLNSVANLLYVFKNSLISSRRLIINFSYVSLAPRNAYAIASPAISLKRSKALSIKFTTSELCLARSVSI